jgi:hypothetical protein
MKKIVIIICLFLLGATFSAKAQEMSQKEKNNYAIGVLLGEKINEKITESGIDPVLIEYVKGMLKEKIDFESVRAGIHDMMNGECKLTKEEIEAILANILNENQFLRMLINGKQNKNSESNVENPE